MTRKECLDKAAGCVLQDRNSAYGGPEDSFGVIANFWSVYLGRKVYPVDVAMMMALLKVARIRNNKDYSDGYIDLAGYAACGAELAGKAEAYRQSIEKAGAEYKRLRAEAEAEGDAKSEEDKKNPLSFEEQAKTFAKHNPPEEPEGNYPDFPDISTEAKPKFKHGDRVQYRVELPSVSDWIWRDATYLRRAFSWQQDGEHIVTDEELGPVTVKDRDIRPAPKAEGCEELVFDEDRMRESMPGLVPQDGPSDMDAIRPHRPTGEELAEMAEEDEKHE